MLQQHIDHFRMDLGNQYYPTDREHLENVYSHQQVRHLQAVKRKIQLGADTMRNKLMKFEKAVEETSDASDLYPRIGQVAHAVPPIAFQKSFKGKNSSSRDPKSSKEDYNVAEVSQQDSDLRGAESQLMVEEAFRHLNHSFEEHKQRCMFIISEYSYENILRKCRDWSPLRKDPDFTYLRQFLEYFSSEKSHSLFKLPEKIQRASTDLIVLHEDKGVLCIQVKAVAPNINTAEEKIEDKMTSAIKQLEKDETVSRTFFPSISDCLTKVLALPNIKRDKCQVTRRSDIKYLFKEDLQGGETSLRGWWDNLTKKAVSKKDIQRIVGRYVGVLSTPTKPLTSNEHHRVRDFCDAILLTSRLFKRLQLTATQINLIKERKGNVYLYGPPGSGKTLMLIEKARSFAKSSSSNAVVILNLYRGKKGRPIGHFVYKTLTSEKSVKRRIEHLPLNINNQTVCEEQLNRIIKRHQAKKVLFIIDEAFSRPYIDKICEHQKTFKKILIWCAGIDRKIFSGLPETVPVTTVLRCPPSVQKVLKQIDWDNERRQFYAEDIVRAAAERGTAGPIPACIRHQLHGETPTYVIDCPKCAHELGQLLKYRLRLIQAPEVDRPSTSTSAPCVTLPCSVAILFGVSRKCYERPREDGQDVEISMNKFNDYAEKVSRCTFLQTLTTELDNIKIRFINIFQEELKEHFDEILVTWVDGFQGLEKDVVVFLPGDVGITSKKEVCLSTERQPPPRELPVPGVGESSQQTAVHEYSPRRSQRVLGERDAETRGLVDIMMKDDDIERFSAWDKTNLFLAASRCCAQLIMVTP